MWGFLDKEVNGRGKMIKPICSLCRKELDDFGAIILSPPDNNHKVEKHHICKLCYFLDISLLLKIKGEQWALNIANVAEKLPTYRIENMRKLPKNQRLKN